LKHQVCRDAEVDELDRHMQIVRDSWKSWEVDVGGETGDCAMLMSIRTEAIAFSIFRV
jgi:hypothetical protein